MGKAPDAFRTISEVAAWLETPPHVLRFWETKFPQVRPVKRAGGRRYYRPDDMTLLGGIKVLLHDQGLTIRGAQKLLREKGSRYVASLSAQPQTDHWGVESDEVIELAVEPGGQTWRPGYAAPASGDEGATRDLWSDADEATGETGGDLGGEPSDDEFDDNSAPAVDDHPTSRPYRADANLATILSSVLAAPEPPAQVIPLRPGRPSAARPAAAAAPAPAVHGSRDGGEELATAALRRDVVRACDPDRLRARADDLRPLVDRLRAVHARLAG